MPENLLCRKQEQGWFYEACLWQVFGLAADPAIVGNVPSNHDPSNKVPRKTSKVSEAQNEVTSKPPEQQRCAKGSIYMTMWGGGVTWGGGHPSFLCMK